MQEFKSIYQFTVTDKVTKSVEKTQTVDGKKAKVTTDETVEVPVEVYFKKPTRRQIEDADLYYAKEINKFVREGLMTRAMLNNKYSDSGGLISEQAQKEIGDAYVKMFKIQEEYVELKKLEKPTKKKKERLSELEEEFASIKRSIIEMESDLRALFDNTADAKAQNNLMRWYALNFTFVKGEDDEKPVPYFKGETIDEKLEDYYAKEESEDELYKQIGSEIGAVIAVWAMNKTTDPEEFKKLIEQAKSLE